MGKVYMRVAPSLALMSLQLWDSKDTNFILLYDKKYQEDEI